jgi:spore coat protein H
MRTMLALSLCVLVACVESNGSAEPEIPPSHAKGDGNYELVFNDATVDRVDIAISASNHQTMLGDMTDIFGEFGEEKSKEDKDFKDLPDPTYVECTVEFGDDTWEHVGIRYKGNSSAGDAWDTGSYKIPFRLSFDRYEDEYPQTDDQRFWGFKDLKFSNAYKDDSLIRDKLASDLFRSAGVPASKMAFVRVFVDTGAGPTYWGLYTMAEDSCGELLDSWFNDDNGNCYKPNIPGGSWAELDLLSFEKKTNEEDEDYSDIEATYDALHSTADGDVWRTNLEASFDVDGFLHYLALNNLMQNWDTYGTIGHNYYLYGDPAAGGRLTWIPWDFNEAFTEHRKGIMSLDMTEVTDEWPLIRYTMDDEEYAAAYYEHLQEALSAEFELDILKNLAFEYHDLIAEYVVGSEGEVVPYTMLRDEMSFELSLDDDLLPTIKARRNEAMELLLDLGM